MARHVPERTCVGCRGRAPRTELLRFVIDERGAVVIDPRAAVGGRGAWCHRSGACVDEALRAGALARALRTGLAGNELGRLRSDVERELTNA